MGKKGKEYTVIDKFTDLYMPMAPQNKQGIAKTIKLET
jgi:hypothetical protein